MKGKRIAACLLAAVTAIVSFSGRVQALSDSELPAPSAVLMEASTGKVLYEKNAHALCLHHKGNDPAACDGGT